MVIVTGSGRAFCVGGDRDALAGHADRGGYDPGLPAEVANPGYGVRPELDHDIAWHVGPALPGHRRRQRRLRRASASPSPASATCASRPTGAKLTTAAPQLGLPAEYGLSWVLPRLIGVTHAADLLLSGRIVLAEEAAGHGPVQRGRAGATSSPTSRAWHARRLATGVSPAAVAATKRQLYDDLLHHDVGASVERSKVLLDELMRGADYREGVAALRERRPPRFFELT